MSNNRHFLCIDVGNTQMVFGLYHGDELKAHWRLSSNHQLTSDELSWQLFGMFSQFEHNPKDLHGILVASVVPHLDEVLSEACVQTCALTPAFIGDKDVKTGMAIDYKNPKEVGADRIVNALAAREMFGAPAIILDCGTATTFDVVSADGRYAGGLIIPGIEVALEALSKRAAKLPEIAIAPATTLIGKDTVSSMQAGVYWSAVDGLNGIIKRLLAEKGYENATIVATGGLSAKLLPDMPKVKHLEPHLTLKGILMLAKKHFKP
ncbi:MAG TPA: type III pantothenate kinase [Ghiorsea sp.]|nr:type III pantothenate kinase [Ghiorsea sp.]HIP07273.1 type III pantothenate kinase [Mariprofundaceae bacterium]